MIPDNEYAELMLADGFYRTSVIYANMRRNPIYREEYFTVPEVVRRLFGTSASIGKGTYATLCTMVRRDFQTMIEDGMLARTDDAHYIFIGEPHDR